MFNKGKYAGYGYGCDVEDLNWKEFPGGCNCSNWDRFGPSEWATILSSQPQFADKCDKWDRFGPWEWETILSWQPQFADKCDKWDRFDDINIACLASEQETFVPKLLQQKKLSPWAAAIVLAKRPNVKVDTKLLSGEVDDEVCSRIAALCDYSISRFETPWAYLLSRQPQFVEKFRGWKTLSMADWIGLLSEQPGLSSHCDWKKFEEEWMGDNHWFLVDGNDELIALIMANTNIDITEDFNAFVCSPTFAKDPDLWKEHLWAWDMSQVEAWSEILSMYPDLVTRFEVDDIEEDD